MRKIIVIMTALALSGCAGMDFTVPCHGPVYGRHYMYRSWVRSQNGTVQARPQGWRR
jgi:uncharacterized protein YceK